MGGNGSDGPMPIGGMNPVLNGDGMDMKSSPANGPGTPRDDGASIPDYNMGSFGPPENVSCLSFRLPFCFVFIF